MALWRRFGGAQPPTDSPRKALQSQYVCAKTHSAAPPTPFPASPRLPVLRRDRHKETRNPEMNKPSPITAPTIRERTTGDPDPRRNRNETYRKPSCLALMRQTAGVTRTQNAAREPQSGRATNTKRRERAVQQACPERKTPRESHTAAQTGPRAHKHSGRSCNRPNATFRRRTIR